MSETLTDKKQAESRHVYSEVDVPPTKYVLVTGGVASSIGKGIVASSLGTIFKSYGYNITLIKIDPYINIDAGTFSPYEHGEVYVLNDGAEVDLDLGNYERFLDTTLKRNNNITTGKIYKNVIEKERRGDYLGKTVQVIPHVTDEIQNSIERVISNSPTRIDVCIIELGGVIGDIESMPFAEAFRQFQQNRVKKEDLCLVHVSLIPQQKTTGEFKTKPTQFSVRELLRLGLYPDVIVCRSENSIDQSVKGKISQFCHVQPDDVISLPDLKSVFGVPILMEEQGVVRSLISKLHLCGEAANDYFVRWKQMVSRFDQLMETIPIAIVGKYVKINEFGENIYKDAYVSITAALQHAALEIGYRVKIEYIVADSLEKEVQVKDPSQYHESWLRLFKCKGVVVPGGFGFRGVEGKIAACKWCREKNVPFLGICLGFQTAVIEFARNKLGIEHAHSSEFTAELMEVDPNMVKESEMVIIDMPEHTQGGKGGTMRLGEKITYFISKYRNNSILSNLYGKPSIAERHRHRYEVDPHFVSRFEENGMYFVGTDRMEEELEDEIRRMEIFELDKNDHPYYVGVQFHPEYTSRPLRPSPPFLGLIQVACTR